MNKLYFILVFIVFFIVVWWARPIKKESFDSKANLEPYVDAIYYINLDHRTDRNEAFLREMDKIEFPREKVKRISGVYEKERGHLGCSKSHILAMEDFLNSNHRNCIVFEDDFEFSQPTETIESYFHQLAKIPYDVCMLAGNEQDLRDSGIPHLKKVNMCLTTSGYMVSKSFAPILLQNFKEGAQLLEKSYNEGQYRGEYAIDQYWCLLQRESKWYIFDPKIGKQRNSFSDIMGGVVDYNV
jgi:hypothetical protein